MTGLVFVSIAVVLAASVMYYLIDNQWEIPVEYLYFTLGCVANTVMTWLFNLFQCESMKHLYIYAYTTVIGIKLHFSWPWFKNFEKRALEVGVHQTAINAIRNMQSSKDFDCSSFKWNGDLLFDVKKFFNSPMMEVYMEVQKNDKLLPFIRQNIFVKVLWLYIHFNQNILDNPTDGIKAIIRFITIYVCLDLNDRYKYFDETVMDNFTTVNDFMVKYKIDDNLQIVYSHLNSSGLFYIYSSNMNVRVYDDRMEKLFEKFDVHHKIVHGCYNKCLGANINLHKAYKGIKFN